MQTRHFPHPKASQNLTETIAEKIRQQLILGELRAGQRLSEPAICEQLGVSRNPVREAFRTLIKEGLLRHEPNKGVSVVVPSIADIVDIYRVRRIIECQALTMSWPSHPSHRRMKEALEQAIEARDAGNWQDVGSANIAFHAAIVGLADSPRLSTMYADISAELRLVFGLIDDQEYMHHPYVDQNARILAIFESGDTAAVVKAMEEYLIHSERMVLARYAEMSR